MADGIVKSNCANHEKLQGKVIKGVYLVEEVNRITKKGTGNYKIGYSNDIFKIINAMQASCCTTTLVLINYYETDNSNEIKAKFRKAFENNSVWGDWFSFTTEEINDANLFIVSKING